MEYRFYSYRAARLKARRIARKRGYMPKVFKLTNPKTEIVSYIVVVPKTWKKIS